MRRLLIDTGSLLLRHLLGVLVGVLMVGLIARKLGAAGLGAWALLGVVGFLVGLSDLGLSVGVGRAAIRGDLEGATRATERAWLVVLVLGPLLGGAAVSWAMAELLRLGIHLGAVHLAACGALVLLGGLAGALAMPLRALLIARGSIPSTSFARTLGALVQGLVLLAGFAVWSGLEIPTGAFAAGALAELIVLALSARAVAPALRLIPGRRSAEGLGGSLREGAAVLVINLAVVVALRVDAAVLTAVASLAAIAAYGVASRAVDQVFGLVKQVSAALQPRMATHQGRDEALRLGSWIQPPLVIGAVGALWFAGEPLLRLWVGPALGHEAFRVALGFLGVAAVVAAFSEVSNAWLALAAPSPWFSALAIGLGCSVNLLVSLLGRHAWGVHAVAGATLLGNTISALIAWFFAVRLLRWRFWSVLGALAPALAALAAVFALGPWAERLALRGSAAALVACASLGGGAVFAAAAVGLGWRLGATEEASCTSES